MIFPFDPNRGPITVRGEVSGPLGQANLLVVLDTGATNSLIRSAVEHYREDVERHAFPSDAESYHLPRNGRPTLVSYSDDSDGIVNSDALQDFGEFSQA